MQPSTGPGDLPNIRSLTSSPLRNRIRAELNASVSEVWSLLGDLPRFPEYSSGLERVESKVDSSGTPTEYVCHFKPIEPSGERIVARELIRWWAPNHGHASSGAGGDAFGMTDDLHLILIEPSAKGATVTWEEYYAAQDVPMMKAHFDDALTDISANLVRRFGGRVVERYVEK